MARFWRHIAIAKNWPVLAAVMVLSALGLLSIWNYKAGVGPRQLLFLAVGVACMLLVQAGSYLNLGRYAWGFYFVSLALVGYTVLGGITAKHNLMLPGVRPHKGAACWISLPGFGSGPGSETSAFSVEPAELLKLAFCMALARYLRFRSNYRTLTGLIPPFALALAPMVLVLKQPALGMAMLFLPALFVMLFVAGAKIRHLAAVIACGLSLLPIGWILGRNEPGIGRVPLMIQTYQWQRVKSMFNGGGPLQDDTYQQERALMAFASGGWTGKGLGNLEIGRHVPEAHNDMIFALIGEQLGFFGTALMLLAYVVLFAAGIEIAAATREPFGRLLAVGIVTMLAGQTFLNLMVATRLMPVTGITLPFVSYGGSSLLASFIAAGLLLNIGQRRPMVMARDAFEFD